MKLNLYKIADLTIAMECCGETVVKQGKPYRTDTGSYEAVRTVYNEINREEKRDGT